MGNLFYMRCFKCIYQKKSLIPFTSSPVLSLKLSLPFRLILSPDFVLCTFVRIVSLTVELNLFVYSLTLSYPLLLKTLVMLLFLIAFAVFTTFPAYTFIQTVGLYMPLLA